MNNLSIGRLISTIVFTVVFSACTTRLEISHSETRKVDTLSDRFRTVSTQSISDPLRLPSMNAQGGFFLIELKSKINLEKIIRPRELAFLYYDLRPCRDVKESSELYSAPAYIDAQAGSIEADSFYYYAAVPRNYPDEIDRYQVMHGREKGALPREICLGLGAGNMAGETLTTNFVRTELKL